MKKIVFYNEIDPAEKLKKHIQCYWYLEYNKNNKKNFEHIVLPDGCTSLIFVSLNNGAYKNTTLFGPRISSFQTSIPPGSKFLGIRFLPGAINSVFKTTGLQLRDKDISAFEIIANKKLENLQNEFENNAIFYKYLNNLLEEIIALENKSLDKYVSFAVNKIMESNGSVKLSLISEELNISERQLLRKFKNEVGLTLKELSRIRRNRAALISMIIDNKKLQDAIFETGFFDQSHFNKDLFSISGVNPKLFHVLYSQIEHGNIIK